MRCLIVEDDPIARAVIERYAQRAGLDVVASAPDAASARHAAAQASFDVAFADVELPDGSGLDVARELTGRAEVVLVTARKRYAVEAFALGAADYLLKPVDYDRFEQALERVRQLAAGRAPEPHVSEDGALPDGPVFVRSAGDLVRVDLRAVTRVEADRDYVRLHGPDVRLHSTMKEIEERLPAPFVRVHRSHIVRLDRVEAVTEAGVTVAGDAVPVGASYRGELAERLPTY